MMLAAICADLEAAGATLVDENSEGAEMCLRTRKIEADP